MPDSARRVKRHTPAPANPCPPTRWTDQPRPATQRPLRDSRPKPLDNPRLLHRDEKGAPSPPFDSVLLAAHAQAPTSVSRRQSRSESPPLGRSRISPKADATAAAAARPPWTRSRRAAREPTRARSRWAIRKRARRRSPDLVLVQGGHAGSTPPFGS